MEITGNIHGVCGGLIEAILTRRASLIVKLVENPPAMQETPIQFLGWEDPLEEGMTTQSSILACKSHGQRSLT